MFCLRWLSQVLVIGMLIATLAVPCFSQQAEPVARGPVWYGVMHTGLREFRFAIETTEDQSGSEVRQLVSFDEGSRAFPLNPFTLNDQEMQFSLKQTNAEYSGTLNASGDLVTGKWKQAGREFDLNFRRQNSVRHAQPDEVWSGELAVLFQKLEVQFRIFHRSSDDGSNSGLEPKTGSNKVLFDSLTQQAGGFVGERRVEQDRWTIEIPGLAGTFVGIRNAEGTEVVGKWSQGGLSPELKLVRRQNVSNEQYSPRRRPQTPTPPFPYDVQEVTFANTADNISLAGTLTIPRDQELRAAAVLISGSGPQDRDESILDHKPFLVIADYLSRHGIAVLRFDDRGVGQSTGTFDAATSEDFATDVQAAMMFLNSHSRTTGRPIGLIGHSEGGIIAPMAAVRDPETSFVVLLAGPGVNGRRILTSQSRLILQAEGITDAAQLKAQETVQAAVLDYVCSADKSTTSEQEKELVRLIIENSRGLSQSATQPRAKNLSSGNEGDEVRSPDNAGILLQAAGRAAELSEEELLTMLQGQLGTLRTPWFQFFLKHEPAPGAGSGALVRCWH